MTLAERVARRILGSPEVIGVPECPILYRWGLFGEDRRGRKRPVKLLLHYFLPESRDRDPHDHPRPFWTFVLAGEYVDVTDCGCRRETSYGTLAEALRQAGMTCPDCRGTGERREIMRRGTLRFREADHTHTTYAGPKGCWTLVLMGPIRRPWGFIREGRWWPWREYEDRFGHGMRCE